jgi:hypothetical protein
MTNPVIPAELQLCRHIGMPIALFQTFYYKSEFQIKKTKTVIYSNITSLSRCLLTNKEGGVL